MAETITKPTKQNVIVIQSYYDLELKRMVKVDETLKVSSTRANVLIEHGFAIKK